MIKLKNRIVEVYVVQTILSDLSLYLARVDDYGWGCANSDCWQIYPWDPENINTNNKARAFIESLKIRGATRSGKDADKANQRGRL